MKVCIAGKNQIAIDGLKACEALQAHYRYDLVACSNRTDDGMDGWQPSFKRYCERAGIPLVPLDALYEEDDLLFLSLEFDRIIKPPRFRTSRLFNIHFSRLPAYKGMFTSVMPLLYGEPVSGVTLHRIDAGIDTGEIIAQAEFPLPATLDAKGLYDLYLHYGTALITAHLPALLDDEITSSPQPAERSSYYSKSALDFGNLQVDLNKTAYEICNQVRAYSFRDYQLPRVCGQPVYKAVILDSRSNAKPGTVLQTEAGQMRVSSVDYDVLLMIDQEALLFRAASEGNISAIQALQATGYPIHIRNKKGWNALIIAAFNGRTDMMNYLLAQGFSADVTNYNGTTIPMYAMTCASRTGQMAVLEFVLGLGTDLTRQDCRDRDVFSYAREYGHPEVIDLLEKKRPQP